ncbi:uncharacterized protein MONOS_1610 [Monocercomonoides exilis]|uniref:uncharacterized protein n=1 Tax=Monocercomonoides exilis TaxID=2049356 RepID=UPI00355ABCFC|nr:hypothetical protein MONOS_1610 [Monocercomonoides exilis]|eukprot:MONOS_1610.1-p1 / transcript=MONOS_1610.1 / gene=MONOS_1610 / organism=Monocercomonoides_exilis_PA203 / gene_product=unspecified product / transcript_product=unspecified product / location=Mono_scaffold00029:90152-91897(+) / protein_length=526 / sequence_SO=supercontig / SO=protein_coding / is_pseudo=false
MESNTNSKIRLITPGEAVHMIVTLKKCPEHAKKVLSDLMTLYSLNPQNGDVLLEEGILSVLTKVIAASEGDVRELALGLSSLLSGHVSMKADDGEPSKTTEIHETLVKNAQSLTKSPNPRTRVIGLDTLTQLVTMAPEFRSFIAELPLLREAESVLLTEVIPCVECDSASSSSVASLPTADGPLIVTAEVKTAMLRLLRELVSVGVDIANEEKIAAAAAELTHDSERSVKDAALLLLAEMGTMHQQCGVKKDTNAAAGIVLGFTGFDSYVEKVRSCEEFESQVEKEKEQLKELILKEAKDREEQFSQQLKKVRSEKEELENQYEQLKIENTKLKEDIAKFALAAAGDPVEIGWEDTEGNANVAKEENHTMKWIKNSTYTALTKEPITSGIWECTIVLEGPGMSYAIGIADESAITAPRNKYLDWLPKGGEINSAGVIWHSNGKRGGSNRQPKKGMEISMEIDMEQRRCVFFYDNGQQPVFYTELPDAVRVGVTSANEGFTARIVLFKKAEARKYEAAAKEYPVPI